MARLTETLALATVWLNIIAGILIFIFGIIGNALNIYVFTRPAYRHNTSALYLLASSVASGIQLLHTLLPRILSDGFQVPIVQSSDRYCQSRNLIAAVASLCAISYPCWASFDQYIRTSRNAMVRLRWSSKCFAFRAALSTFLFWSLINIPNTIFSRAKFSICFTDNRIINLINAYGIVPLSYFILPAILFTYFNIGIMKNLRDTAGPMISNINKRMARQVQRMLIPQLIILILSGLPFTIQVLYSIATAPMTKTTDRLAIEAFISHITRLLFYLNYISSFYIYLLTSSEFRKIIRNLFTHRARIAVIAIA